MSLPLRESKRNFDRYAPWIAKALQSYPLAYSFTLGPNSSVNTFRDRCKDALTFGVKYGYEHPLVDRIKFYRLAPLLKVAVRGKDITIGTAEAIKHPLPMLAAEQDNLSEYELKIKDNSQMAVVIQALRYMEPRPSCFVLDPSPGMVAFVEDNYDHLLSPDEKQPAKHYLI